MSSKNRNFISTVFICFVFTLFINCSGTKNPMQDLPSQNEDGQTTNDPNNGDDTTTETTTTTENSGSTEEDESNDDLVSCGSAAGLAGYGGYGSDGQSGTSDDPHIYSTSADSCEDLEILGHDDWEDFTFQEDSGATQNNDQVREVIQSGGVCCVRDDTSSFAEEVPGTNGHGCPVPNERAIVEQVRDIDPDRFQKGSDLNWIRATNGPRSVLLNDPRWAFMDAVVTELRKKDKRWGFTCVWGNCNDPSTDAIAYWCGQGDPGDSTNVGTVDIITGSHKVAWQDHAPEAMKNKNSTAKWIYPRPSN